MLRRGEKKQGESRELPLDKEVFEREILLWAQDLAWEMNLRLLMDDELGIGKEERILFVENVSVTGIQCPEEHKKGKEGKEGEKGKKGKGSLFERIKQYFKRKKELLWQLLNNLLGFKWTS